MNVQIFGTNKSQATRKALRFFKERGIKPQYFDLQKQEVAVGQFKRFVQKFGLNALLDTGGKAYRDAGLEYLRVGEQQLLDMLVENPKLLLQPLVRSGATLAVGWDEAQWRSWYEANK